jgi:cytochrome subunit of sulfide dehydrogenase
MIMKCLFTGASSAALLLSTTFSAPVLASEATCMVAGEQKPASVCAAQTRIYASTCYICHGPNGKSNQSIPGLAGQDKAYLVQAMKEQKAGKRETTVMKKYMLGFTDAEIEQMAEFFAGIK